VVWWWFEKGVCKTRDGNAKSNRLLIFSTPIWKWVAWHNQNYVIRFSIPIARNDALNVVRIVATSKYL